MANLETSIVITGPTTTGKSEISALLAREVGGAIINTDSYYLYAGAELHVGLGLSQQEPPVDIPCYLFGGRNITEPRPTTEDLYECVIDAAEDARSHDHLPVIQGCSFTLSQKIIQTKLSHRIYVPIWRNTNDLIDRCKSRVDQMLDEGLIGEAERIIEHGHEDTWVARKGIIYRPTIEFVKRGKRDVQKLVGEISLGIISKAKDQEAKYRLLSGVVWIPHDNNPQEAVDAILEKLD